jgi:transposase
VRHFNDDEARGQARDVEPLFGDGPPWTDEIPTVPANIRNLPDFKVQRVVETDHDYRVYAEVSTPPRGRRQLRLYPPDGPRPQRAGHPRFANPRSAPDDLRGHTAIQLRGVRPDLHGAAASGQRQAGADRPPGEVDRPAELKGTFASIADDTSLDARTIRKIFRNYINELEAQFRFETPTWMGSDEIHLIKPRCVISNMRSNTIVNMLPNREKETVVNNLYSLPGKEEVQYIAMDMWTPYRYACSRFCPAHASSSTSSTS